MPQPYSQPPTSSLKSSNLLSMFQRKLTHPIPLQLKILIQIQDNIPSSYRPAQDFTLAHITIYTQKHVFQGVLKGKNIIKQLAWTVESMNTLLDCLKGKRDNNKVETRFFPVKNGEGNSHQSSISSSNIAPTSNYIYQNICQISSGINLPLFSVQLYPSPLSPFLHMQQKFSSLQSTFRSRSLTYKQKQQHLKSQLNQIQAVQKQIIYSSTTEIQLMKKEFIKHVNKQKAKIRKLMGSVPVVNPVSGMIENRGRGNGIAEEDKGLGRIVQKQLQQQQQEKQQRTQSATKNRQIKKVNRQQYNKPQPQKLQVQDSSQSQKIYSQSSSLSSKQHQILKRQKPHGQNPKYRFASDHDSSSQQDLNQAQGQQNDKGKTFLELQRQRLQRQKRLNNGKKEQQGDVWEDLVI